MCDIVTTCDSKHGQAIACRLKALSCTDFSRLFCIFVCAGL